MYASISCTLFHAFFAFMHNFVGKKIFFVYKQATKTTTGRKEQQQQQQKKQSICFRQVWQLALEAEVELIHWV